MAIIRFKVENSWLDSNSLATGDAKMVKWDGSDILPALKDVASCFSDNLLVSPQALIRHSPYLLRLVPISNRLYMVSSRERSCFPRPLEPEGKRSDGRIAIKQHIANQSRAKVIANAKGSLYPRPLGRGFSLPFEPVFDKWILLDTTENGKDASYAYFEAKTDTFSIFAITGLKGGVLPTATPTVTQQPEKTSTGTGTATITQTPTSEAPPVKLAIIMLVIVIMIAIVAVVYIKRKEIFKK